MSQVPVPLLDPLSLLGHSGQRTDALLRQSVRQQAEAPPRLVEAIEYSLFAGGKRLRPTLVLACARACGAERDEGLPAAAAIELIHTFSLVHDDLPAMDDDDLRRGRPTSHKVFGEAMAILAGDAMVMLAFELVAARCPADLVGPVTVELSRASGVAGMIGGQVLDMESENRSLTPDELRRVHRLKTGALLTASCRLGAISARAGEQQLDWLTAFGRHLGLAFQIVDDILDVTSTPQQLGKATRKDAARGKNTYPRLLGLDESRRQADEQLALAMAALAPLGASGAELTALANFVVRRDK